MDNGMSPAAPGIDREASFPDDQQPSWRVLRGLPICHCGDRNLKLMQPPANDMRLNPDIVGS
jgi:hypothetical protein